MYTITNTLKKPDGSPLRSIPVRVELSWDKTTAPFVKTDDTVVDSLSITKTDVDGVWSMDLLSNDDLTPISVYKITETVSDTDINIYYISVESSNAWVGDILTPTPAWEA